MKLLFPLLMTLLPAASVLAQTQTITSSRPPACPHLKLLK